jgi:hypothetical protein
LRHVKKKKKKEKHQISNETRTRLILSKYKTSDVCDRSKLAANLIQNSFIKFGLKLAALILEGLKK